MSVVGPPDSGEQDEVVEFETMITNEFTSVRVRKVQTGNGERLELDSMRLPHSIRLDALVLESLTWRSVLELGQSLETPFGPEAEGADLEPEGTELEPGS